MARFRSPRSTFLKTLVNIAGVAALVCAPGSTAWAQHGGGHAGGGGHFGGGGGGHMSSPHVSAPPAPHFSAPAHAPGRMGAGTHNYVAAPPPAVPPPAAAPCAAAVAAICPAKITGAITSL